MKRLVAWPFTAFLLGYGVPTNDPTVGSLIDEVLSSTVTGMGLALIAGLPLALIFRRGDTELAPRAVIPMLVALAATVSLDPLGFGLIGAAGYVFWTRGQSSERRPVELASKPSKPKGGAAAIEGRPAKKRLAWLPVAVLVAGFILYAASTITRERAQEEAPSTLATSSSAPDFYTWYELPPDPQPVPIR